MARVISWIFAALSVIWALTLMWDETQSIIQGPEPKIEAAKLPIADPQTSITLQQDENEIGKKLLVTKLADKFSIDRSAISVGEAVGASDAQIRVMSDPAKFAQLIDCFDEIEYALRELEINTITLSDKSGKPLRVYKLRPDTLNFPIDQDIITMDLLDHWSRSMPSLSGITDGIKVAIAHSCLSYIDKCLKAAPNQPDLIAYRFVVSDSIKLGNDAECLRLAQGFVHDLTDNQNRADLALHLRTAIGCGGSEGNNKDVGALVKFIEENVHPDTFRAHLIARLYQNDNQPEKAQQALNSPVHDRQEVHKFLAINVAMAIFAIAICVVYALRKKKLLFDGKPLSDAVASPVAYGWWKPPVIVVLSMGAWLIGLVIMQFIAPLYTAEEQVVLLSYFEPVRSAMYINLEEYTLMTPAIVWTYVFVGTSLPFLEFVKLRLQGNGYSTKELVRMGLESFIISWAPAVVATFISMYYHWPAEKASTISVGLITSSSGSIVAILVLLIGFSIFAPIFEEIAFRGILHPALRRHWKLWPSLIVGSVLFALMHMEFAPWLIVDKFIFAAVNIYALEKSGSIVPGIINHVLTNSLVLVLVALGG